MRIRIIGQSKAYAIATTIPPRNIEPVSPIKTFAGYLFQTKKPAQPPRRAAEITPIPRHLWTSAITIKLIAAVAVTEEQSPSIPSVKLTALIAP